MLNDTIVWFGYSIGTSFSYLSCMSDLNLGTAYHRVVHTAIHVDKVKGMKVFMTGCCIEARFIIAKFADSSFFMTVSANIYKSCWLFSFLSYQWFHTNRYRVRACLYPLWMHSLQNFHWLKESRRWYKFWPHLMNRLIQC